MTAPAERCHTTLLQVYATGAAPSASCPHSLQVYVTGRCPPVARPAAACLHFEVRNQPNINAMHPPRIENGAQCVAGAATFLTS